MGGRGWASHCHFARLKVMLLLKDSDIRKNWEILTLEKRHRVHV